MSATTAGAETQRWAEEFARLAKPLAAGVSRAALDRFVELGFPTTDDEDWRFTSVAPIAGAPWRPAGAAFEEGRGLEALGAARARRVRVNGRLAAGRGDLPALPPGVTLSSLAEARAAMPALLERHLARHAAWKDQAFVALNTALLEDGELLHVPKGVAVEEPIEIAFLSAGPDAASHPRLLIVLEEGAEARVVETYAGPEGTRYFTNAVTEIVLGPGARLDHVKVQRESRAAFHVATMQAVCGRDAVLHSYNFSLGAALARNDVNALFDGEGCDYVLDGLYLAGGAQHVDNHTLVDHAKPHCGGREVYRGILDGAARGVFNGKIIVRPDAQKTDAKQTNKNLLLSEEAQIDTKPQLEIFANDVKCTHGATVGRLDDEALFYLRARGVPASAARAMLTYAFASEIVGHVKVEPVRRELEQLVHERLGAGHVL
jgi:Fe-S cluster assembly protein SufD